MYLPTASDKILVTGATGYIGGRLVPRLLEKGYKVRAMSRSLDKLKARKWAKHENVELIAADMLDKESLRAALEGCSIAYYLVHSMEDLNKDFDKLDRQAALNFVEEGRNLKRIIYLGGLGDPNQYLSKHLKSRIEVGKILQQSGIPTTIFRAAMIIGAGSASFEILRYLVERLPFMFTPKWVRSPCQPILVINALHYLIECLKVPETIGQTFDIGGPEITTYEKMMEIYAELSGLPKRKIIKIPLLTPWLSSHWIGLVTPLPAALAKPLVIGLKSPVICQENRIRELIPQELFTIKKSIQRALNFTIEDLVETSWVDAGKIPPAEWIDTQDPKWAGGTYFEEKRFLEIPSSKENVWGVLMRIGGKNGWYAFQWLWNLRGFIDRMVGGIGLRRGRRDLFELKTGDALDFWRVRLIEPNKRLVLAAEMKLPGEAILEFQLSEINKERTRLTLFARFLPSGLSGILYWYLVSPFHFFIFSGMLKKIAKKLK